MLSSNSMIHLPVLLIEGSIPAIKMGFSYNNTILYKLLLKYKLKGVIMDFNSPVIDEEVLKTLKLSKKKPGKKNINALGSRKIINEQIQPAKSQTTILG